MARYRGRHRAPSTAGRTIARTAVAGAVLTVPLVAAPAASAQPGSTWDRLAQCESSGKWNINTGNGYSGGLQFSPRTWTAFGGEGRAHQASREQQIAVAERVLAQQGWGAWPACSRKLGLRGTPPPIKAKPAKPSTSSAAKPQPTAKPASPVVVKTSGRTVTVQRGDTLARIASANRVAGGWKALHAANRDVQNPNVLRVGQVLDLP
jgi:LysM repeat protein